MDGWRPDQPTRLSAHAALQGRNTGRAGKHKQQPKEQQSFWCVIRVLKFSGDSEASHCGGTAVELRKEEFLRNKEGLNSLCNLGRCEEARRGTFVSFPGTCLYGNGHFRAILRLRANCGLLFCPADVITLFHMWDGRGQSLTSGKHRGETLKPKRKELAQSR